MDIPNSSMFRGGICEHVGVGLDGAAVLQNDDALSARFLRAVFGLTVNFHTIEQEIAFI